MANTTVNIDIEVQSKSLGQLEAELGDINEQLREVEVGSDAFKKLSAESQKLTAEVEKVNKEIEGFTFEDKIQSADGAVKLLGGSLAATVGVLGTLGVESEAFGEFEKKAASAIAVAVGFKDISEGIQQLGPFLKQAGTAVKGFSITTKQALIATGIGAFAVAIGSIIAYWDDITAAVEKFGQKVPFVGKALDAIKEGFNAIIDAARPVLEFLGILPDEAERAAIQFEAATNENIRNLEREVSVAQAAGESAKKIYELRKQLIENEIALLETQADKEEELFKKRTELLVLEAAERKRISDEYVGQIERETQVAVQGVETRGIAQMKGVQITADTSNLENDIRIRNQQAAFDEAQQKISLDQQVSDSRIMLLNTIQGIADQESAIGKAAFLARQALLIQEIALEAKASLTRIAQKGAEASVDASAGFIKTAAAGFPQNIPLLIAYGLQIGALIATMVKATKKAKGSVGSIQASAISGGGSPTVSAPRPNTQPVNNTQSQVPQFTDVAPTVRAYVLSGDVTSAQEADSKLNRKRTIAG